MGGKKKKTVNSTPVASITKQQSTVSIVTVTQLKRKESIKILIDIIAEQDYPYIIEWVIVEGTPCNQDSITNQTNIQELIKNSKLKFDIKYIVPQTKTQLGGLRNLGNNACSGDITVCMDDDDYYPPTRVSHAVEKLTGSSCLIAGCTSKFLYDYPLQRMYKFGNLFGKNHSTNDCMAWKKEYLLTHSHDPTKKSGEEPSFTNTFSEPMVQLDSKHVIIGSSHFQNTFNKRELCIIASNQLNQNMFEVNDLFEKHIPKHFSKRFKELYTKPKMKNNFDISYYTGIFSIDWDPEDMSLGGSEQAVVNLASEWVKKGKKVAVYGKIPRKTYHGVEYFPSGEFPFDEEHNLIILWRASGLMSLGPFNVKVTSIYLDLHDNIFDNLITAWEKYSNKIDKIFFKSIYHKICFEEKLKTKVSDYSIIPNGIRLNQFSKNHENVNREPYRFCYCSCYTRGLMEILAFVWPVIFKNFPRAELHIYYGMEQVNDDNFKKNMTLLLSQPGVMDHSRQPMETIITEKWKSTFQLYITKSIAEIDCISIRESIASGCIPLLSNCGVFPERDGLHFDIKETSDHKEIQNNFTQIGMQICNLLSKPDFVNICRNKFKSSETLIDWESVATKWEL